MSYADNSAAGKHSQEANHYHPTPWLRKWALVETGTFIQSPLRGDMALRLPAEWPTAAASCNHVPVTMDDLSGGVLHSWMVDEKGDRLCFIQITCGPHCQHALMPFKNTNEISSHYAGDIPDSTDFWHYIWQYTEKTYHHLQEMCPCVHFL